MSDFLVEMGPTGRKVVSRLGLPIPLPEKLRRDVSPWSERPLHDLDVVVQAGPLAAVIAETLATSGANPYVVGDDAAFVEAGEAWGRGPKTGEAKRPHALLLDATGITGPADLRQLYEFFGPRVRSIGRSGRCVVVGRIPGGKPAEAAARRALEGFVKSLAKEVGRKGATANLVLVQDGAEERVQAVLAWLLSPRSAYLDGQPIEVTKSVKKADYKKVRSLHGKTALVTGAARGIGAATARALAREGARVIVLDRPADDGPASLTAQEVGGELLLVDVTDPEAAAKINAAAPDGIDILVNNAGVTRDKTLAKMDDSRWDMTIGINLEAVIRITEEVNLNSFARVICLSSIAGIAGNFGQTNYAASKAGVIGFVEAMAPKFARRGITINAIAPGFIETRLTHAIPVATREVARRLSALSQGGLPEDIAEAVTFLATPGACGVNGQIIRVCGLSFVGA